MYLLFSVVPNYLLSWSMVDRPEGKEHNVYRQYSFQRFSDKLLNICVAAAHKPVALNVSFVDNHSNLI